MNNNNITEYHNRIFRHGSDLPNGDYPVLLRYRTLTDKGTSYFYAIGYCRDGVWYECGYSVPDIRVYSEYVEWSELSNFCNNEKQAGNHIDEIPEMVDLIVRWNNRYHVGYADFSEFGDSVLIGSNYERCYTEVPISEITSWQVL